MIEAPIARVVLGYAGTVECAASLAGLIAGGCEVVTVTIDVGQTVDVDHVREHALAAGALRAHVLDAREEFARDIVVPALRSVLHDAELSADAFSASPLVRRKLADVAAIERASRIEGAEAFDRRVGTARGSYNGRTLLERPVADAAQAPDVPAHVDVRIDGGMPVAINDVPLSVAELLESLALIAGRHGIGRLPSLDAPAVPVMHAAYRALRGTDGMARFELRKGILTELPAHNDNPLLVNHA